LKKYEIPYFLSSAVDVMTLPAIKMIFCALRAISTYRPEDVIAYVKSSYLDINEGDLNEFESYIFKWNIYGKRFKDHDYWLANPDGYVQRMNKSQLDRRGIVHQVRDLVISKLEILEKAFKTALLMSVQELSLNFLTVTALKKILKLKSKNQASKRHMSFHKFGMCF
jgi:ATP-dependent helicase/DNAse subunit B